MERPDVLVPIVWKPGGARGNAKQEFADGEQYLFAIRVRTVHADKPDTEGWEFAVVTARCDDVNEGEGCWFEVEDEIWDAWGWGSIEWFVPCEEIDLPCDQ